MGTKKAVMPMMALKKKNIDIIQRARSCFNHKNNELYGDSSDSDWIGRLYIFDANGIAL